MYSKLKLVIFNIKNLINDSLFLIDFISLKHNEDSLWSKQKT